MADEPTLAETIRELIAESGLSVDLPQQLAETVIAGRDPNPAGAPVKQLGRYAITGHLGAGGMGEVLQVRDEEVGRQLAAKVIRGHANPQMLAKFVREAQITGQLEHPSIVPLYELGMTPDKRVYFTMKRVQGQDLAALLQAEGDGCQRSLIQYLGIFGKVCDALSFAHSRGVIHRDLKPANIMVGRFGEVQVMDWGLAKVVGQPDPAAGGCALDLGGGQVAAEVRFGGPLKTLDGAVVGTPAYMPPEQASGEVEGLDLRADVYSLGAILYEMLTLEPPYESESVWTVLQQVREGKLIRPSERAAHRNIPWELDAVVSRAMAVRPEDRYETVERLKSDIESYLEGHTLAAADYSPVQLLGKWVRRHRYLCGAAASVLLVTLGILGWVRWRRFQRIEGHFRRAHAAQQNEDFDQAIAQFDRVLATEPRDARARQGLARAILAQARRQIGDAAGAPLLRARWSERDRLLRDGAPERPEEPEVRQQREKILQAYLAGVATLDRGLSRLPESAKLRAARLQAGKALGWAALLGRDYSLARQAFSQLMQAGLAPDQVEQLVAQVSLDRQRRLQLWKQRVGRIVADIRHGLHRKDRAAGAANFEDHVIEASAYRHPKIVAQLGQALRQYVIRVAPGRGPQKMPWSQSERDLSMFICQVLGRLGLRESVAVLGEWMQVVVDDRLAAECGIALCNTRRAEAHARLTAAAKRLGYDSGAWAQIAPFFARIPEPSQGQLETATDYHDRGQARRKKGDMAGAIADFDRAIRIDPGLAMAYNARGITRLTLGDLAGAIADYDRAIKISPTSAMIYNNRGNARKAQGDLGGAIADYDRAIKIDPEHSLIYNNRGNVRRAKGDLDGAIADFDRAIQIDPTYAMALSNRALARKAKGDLDGAIADFARAIKSNPRYATAYINRGNTWRAKGNLAAAISDYDRAIQIDPRRTAAYIGRGLARKAKGDRDGAISDYDLAIQIDPECVDAYINRGLMRGAKGDLGGAISDYDRGIKLDPRHRTAYYNRAIARSAKGDLAGALADYDLAIKIHPRFMRALINRALLRHRKGDVKGAMADFDRAIIINPRFAPGYQNRGIAHMAAGELKGALADFDAALKIEPDDWLTCANRGVTLARLGRRPEAVVSLRRAERLAPKKVKAQLAKLIEKIGRQNR